MSNLKTAFSPCFIYDLLKAAYSRENPEGSGDRFSGGKIKKPV